MLNKCYKNKIKSTYSTKKIKRKKYTFVKENSPLIRADYVITKNYLKWLRYYCSRSRFLLSGVFRNNKETYHC